MQRKAIEAFVAKHHVSPVTGQGMKITGELSTNHLVKHAIERWDTNRKLRTSGEK